MSLHTFAAPLARQVTVDDLLPITGLFRSLDTMHRRGIFGEAPSDRDEFSFQPDLPITSRSIPVEILAEKWALVHGNLSPEPEKNNVKPPLSDAAERQRFIEEHGRNISVIAPAGVGKTYSIVQRILHLAQRPEAEAVDRLSRLVVVTYSGPGRAGNAATRPRRNSSRPGTTENSARFSADFFRHDSQFLHVQLLGRFGHYLESSPRR